MRETAGNLPDSLSGQGRRTRLRHSFTHYRAHLVLLLALTLVPARGILRAQNAGQCTNEACTWCVGIAEVDLIACRILGSLPCVQHVEEQLQLWLATAAPLPPDPPLPAPEPTSNPYSCPIFGEAVTPTGPQPRVSPRPEAQPTPQCLDVQLIDPVPNLVNTAGNGIVTTRRRLATQGTVVQGIAADGVARLVIRIKGVSDGEQFQSSLQPGDSNGTRPVFLTRTAC
jgi:hypothetical protein